jgi:lysylphosphatidylglycerol synthetase-like protein (DUF2156 family)
MATTNADASGTVTLRLPSRRRLRMWLLVGGALALAWMGPEDHTVVIGALLGTLLAIPVVLWWAAPRYDGQRLTPARFTALCGALAALTGAAAPIIAALLLFFKNAWHAHGFWDYPPALIADLLLRTPLWVLAGALIGVGLAQFTLAVARPGLPERRG